MAITLILPIFRFPSTLSTHPPSRGTPGLSPPRLRRPTLCTSTLGRSEVECTGQATTYLALPS